MIFLDLQVIKKKNHCSIGFFLGLLKLFTIFLGLQFFKKILERKKYP